MTGRLIYTWKLVLVILNLAILMICYTGKAYTFEQTLAKVVKHTILYD